MKKILSLFLCFITLFFCAGCGKKEEKYADYSLKEAYEQGFLTDDDLMHISYFLYGEVKRIDEQGNAQTVEFTPSRELSALSKKQETAMKKSYRSNHLDDFVIDLGNGTTKNYGIEIIELGNFLGNYNGYYVVEVKVETVSTILDATPHFYEIGNFEFFECWGDGGPPWIITVFREKKN